MSFPRSEAYNELTLVDLHDNSFTINNVFKDMTVSRFKRAVGIKARLPQSSWDDIRLLCGETELQNDQTLESCNIENESRIHFISSTPRPKPKSASSQILQQPPTYEPQDVASSRTFDNVFVRSTNDGKTFTFNHVPHDELVGAFRNRVADKLGWSRDDAHYIRLIYIKQLEDEKDLMFYNIQNGSTIEMVMRLEGGH